MNFIPRSHYICNYVVDNDNYVINNALGEHSQKTCMRELKRITINNHFHLPDVRHVIFLDYVTL